MTGRGRHRRPPGRARRRLTAAGLLVVALAIGATTWWIVGSAGEDGGGPAGGSAAALRLELPEQVPAAEPISVRVHGAPIGATVSLASLGGLGATTADSISGAEGALFRIPSATTRWAGLLTFVARSGATIVTGTVTVVPGPLAGPMMAVVGPEAIVADGRDTAMMVSVPADAWGNAGPDGTPVTMVRRGPAGTLERRRLRTSGLVTYATLRSGTRAGAGQVGLSSGPVSSAAATLVEFAGPPTGFELRTAGAVPDADGRSLLRIRTSTLRDRHGNVQPDGTAVRLITSGVSGPGDTLAYTVRGRAEFTLEAPDRAGTVRLRAECRGARTGETLRVTFAGVRPRIPVTATRDDSGITVRVGPVTSAQGGLLVDGTPVTVTVSDRSGNRADGGGQLIGGVLSVTLPADGLSGTLQVRATVLGVDARQSLR